MTKVKILLLASLMILSLISLVIFYRGGSIAYDPQRIIDTLPLNVDMQLSGVQFTEMTGDRREWAMESETMHYLKSKNMLVFEEVKATFFRDKGSVQVTGARGYYDREKKTIRLAGRVKAKDWEGRQLSTEELRYDVTTRILSAPGSFVMKGPEIQLTGQGLSVDTQNSQMTVTGRPTLVVQSSKDFL